MNEKNGRVTTREFYDALIAMDRRLGDKIDGIHSELAKGDARFAAMDKSCVVINKRIDKNEDGITKVRNINTFIALLGSTVAGIIGWNK